MKDENVSNAILVIRGDITPFAKQAVLEMSDSFRIEHFKEAELLVDITEHTLVCGLIFAVKDRGYLWFRLLSFLADCVVFVFFVWISLVNVLFDSQSLHISLNLSPYSTPNINNRNIFLQTKT